MKRLTKALAVVTSVAALASAGAATALATDPSPPALLGANIQSTVYMDQGGELMVINEATIPEEFRFKPAAGWHVTPASVQLKPDAYTSVVVSGDGQDGAPVQIFVAAANPHVAPGEQASQLLLTAHVFLETPFDAWKLVERAIPFVALALLIAWLIWRFKPWQLRLTRR